VLLVAAGLRLVRVVPTVGMPQALAMLLVLEAQPDEESQRHLYNMAFFALNVFSERFTAFVHAAGKFGPT
jgi:hypothetical protein